MKKFITDERLDWQTKADEQGFKFHTMYGEPYWDESSFYAFSLTEVETEIEDPSTELHDMCRQAVDEIVESEELMDRMGIPSKHMDLIADSWKSAEPELYGRFDLAYDGVSSAKMLEYNADTPTSLFEAASFQWQWLEDKIKSGSLPANADQFNSIFESLVERFREIFEPGENVHFASAGGIDNIEDYGTVETLGWAASEAGIIPHYVKLEDIGISNGMQFADSESRVIGSLFKLYPWEDLLQDEFSAFVKLSTCRMIEPAWKAIVSNKGILPVLWKMFPGHRNLLPAYWQGETHNLDNYVVKPIFSREGSSIDIYEKGKTLASSSQREYDSNAKIVQAYYPLPEFSEFYPVIGSWIVGTRCVGMGIREDKSRITQNLSRFKPHAII
jgi:glutathionylspermidine synthase